MHTSAGIELTTSCLEGESSAPPKQVVSQCKIIELKLVFHFSPSIDSFILEIFMLLDVQ